MPTAIIRPLAIGYVNQATLVAGVSKVAAADTGDPVAHDDATSHYSISPPGQQTQAFTTTGYPSEIGAVNSVSIGSRQNRTVAGATGADFVRLGGSNIQGHTGFVTAAWTTLSPTSVARPGGGNWQTGDMTSALEMGTQASGAGGTVNTTSVWLEVVYQPVPGGFLFLLNLAGLSMLPFVGRMADYAQFMKYLDWRRVFHPRGTILEPKEVLQAWDEYKAYRWPTYFEVAA